MHVVQTVTDFERTTVTEGWSSDEDPEHHSFEPFITESEDGEGNVSEAEVNLSTYEQLNEALHRTESSEDFDDKEFLADLKWACQWVFNGFSQSTHSSAEDLQQEVLIKFWRWLPRYRNEANRRTVFVRIATNILIDARRYEVSNRRQHLRVHLDDLEWELEQGAIKTKIEDQIILKECRETLSGRELVVYDHHFILGESLQELAEKYGVTRAAMFKTRARIIKKLHARYNPPSRCRLRLYPK